MKSMNARVIFFAVMLCGVIFKAAADKPETHPVSPDLERRYYGAWEQDIGYTQAISIGNSLYLSGMTCDQKTMPEQISCIYQEIGKILKDYNLSFDDIVKENIYTTDIEQLKQHIALRKSFFSQGKYPAATWVQVEQLFMPHQMLEVEVIVRLK